MKIIVTTSDSYHHILPVFFFLFEKYWGGDVELAGYKEPKNLPANCTFHSMGEQRGPSFFSDDLIKYFETQDDYFCWLMEDTFLKETVKKVTLMAITKLMREDKTIGRFSLSSDSIKHYTEVYDVIDGITIYKTPPVSAYHLSTQPAIWNKKFLLKWLWPNHSPWEFENLKGTIYDHPENEFVNLALDKFNAPIQHNEGVRKRDLFAFDLNGIDENVIAEMKQLNIL